MWTLGSRVVPRSQRHGRPGFWDTKATDPLKLKGLYKGERVVPRQGQRRAQVNFV